MEKKQTEISVNSSSGAEKVERIEAETQGERVKKTVARKQTSAKGAAAMGGKSSMSVKKMNAQSTDGKAEKENAQAKARVEKALAKKQEQAERKAKKAEERKKRLAEKKAKIEKRAAEKKARAAKHAAERKALAEKRKAEKEEKLRARAKAKAGRNNANYEKKKAKAKTKSERKQKRENREGRNKGYGGWIAAVVSLGVVTLALATTVTVGAVEMNRGNERMMNGYKSTMYELTGIMENVDNDLDRARISNSPVQQSRILTDLLVQTRMAELDLEKLPMSAETDANVTSFINRTAMECERMLVKLRNGEKLSQTDMQTLEKLYQTNHAVRGELSSLLASMTDKDLTGFLKDGAGKIRDTFDRIEKSTLEENGKGLGQMAGVGMELTEKPAEKEEKKHIEAATAESLCTQYFEGYAIGDFQCVGETVTRGLEAYNIQGYDDRGNQLFAEVSQADGVLLRFDYYEDCSGETFDLGNAEMIAEEFLEKLGYDDLEIVRVRSNGTTSDFTFVYEEDGVAYYPDEIRVKVCRSRGIVSGFDCVKYLRNHRERKEAKVGISLADAKDRLYAGLEMEGVRVAVVQTARGERTAYEFLCGYGEEKYLVYLDAVSGEEISIVNLKSIG